MAALAMARRALSTLPGSSAGYRTAHCGKLGLSHVGQEVTLSGWVASSRLMGSLFFAGLRDASGVVQVVLDKEAEKGTAEEVFDQVAKVREESVVRLTGIVQPRPESMVKSRHVESGARTI